MPENAALRQRPGFGVLNLQFGCSTFILALTILCLGAGAFSFFAWRVTGNDAWIEFFFQVPGALFTVMLAATGLVFSLRVIREFSPGQSLRTAWQLVSISAAGELAGSISSHILGSNPILDVLHRLGIGSGSVNQALQHAGFLLGGTFRFGFLAAGLFCTLAAYRRTRFLAKLTLVDWFLLALVAGYILREFWDVRVAFQHGKRFDLVETLGWPVDPLLCLMLAEAILLFRSARQMGHGWIGRCWIAFSIGIGLVVLGNFASWATNYGYLPWPWSSLGWYVWLPAEGAFALGPIYQLEAIYHAHGATPSSPGPRN